ncbi:hypothetical protein BAUCODRAFT_105919 [Baudoinia panamericana UAMH 10762]|uniref:FAD/NAD(P)-binding domain-containing protein n=1 Tax=Baudoinia panamericana (strain UAMH 10762) TaxID=717646 RepID=M2N3J3_BAUPA|nr:uncharacterized protein BAUCODRAFT_105919 [Baudoinia panamericana UAMH 10762]EMC98528.1 hypothetical protein BAUCODRAFT_105919 [Baudoinia panamericana UAMH 10762]
MLQTTRRTVSHAYELAAVYGQPALTICNTQIFAKPWLACTGRIRLFTNSVVPRRSFNATYDVAHASRLSIKAGREASYQGTLHPSFTKRKSRTARFATVANFPSKQTQEYGAIVVGAGPAGVTCVGNLLERGVAPILWVDPAFNGGRVNAKYREVPSNTKVQLFIDFATAVTPFRQTISDGTPKEPTNRSGSLDPTKGCHLSHAADMILTLTKGLLQRPDVVGQRGYVTDAELDLETERWSVNVEGEAQMATATTKRVVFCTGSSPTEAPLPENVNDTPRIDLDDALSPTLLTKKLTPLGPTTISVIGASHSAILVLRNLYNLAASAKPDLRIRWCTRHALRYAEYMDNWILRDNTGLKGEVATWAKEHLEPEVFPKSPVSKFIDVITYEKGEEQKAFEQHLPGSDFVIQAIGYTREPIPRLRTSKGEEIDPHYDHENGTFTYAAGPEPGTQRLPGLYGAGIAWPERVKDPYGNVEYAVGFWKFMKYVKRVSPHWN